MDDNHSWQRMMLVEYMPLLYHPIKTLAMARTFINFLQYFKTCNMMCSNIQGNHLVYQSMHNYIMKDNLTFYI